MPFTNYPQGFAAGVSVRGMPLLQTQPGQVFYVDNGTALLPNQRACSDGNRGTFLDPFATLAFALSQCVANRGDIIFIGAGHAETISSATVLTLAVAGVAIIGQGAGSLRPTLTFTAAAANIPVTAANISIQNVLFVGNFLSIASVFTVTGTALAPDFAVDNCEFRDNSAVLGFLTIMTGNATANCLDGFTFTNNKIFSKSTVSVTCAILMTATSDRISIRDNTGVSAITSGTQGPALLATGANSLTNFDCGRNRFIRPNTSTTIPVGISTSGTSWTGLCYDNYFWSLNSGTGIWINTGTKLGFVNNYSPITGAADKSALINPVAV